MFALYGVDVFGPVRVSLLEGLLERLAYEPTSLWRAKQMGGAEWFGWGAPEMQRADMVDRLSMVAKAQGKAGRLSPSERYPRPVQSERKRVVSTRDWSSVEAMFGGM